MADLPVLFGFEADQIKKAVEAYKKFNQKKQQAKPCELFSDEAFYIFLQIQFNRRFEQQGQVPAPLLLHIPNPFYDINEVDICLFVGNKGRNDDDELVEKFEGKFGINKVITRRQLKREYDSKEALVKLWKQYDLFLVDDQQDVWITKFLGFTFAAKCTYPLRVHLGEGKEATASLGQQITDICNSTWITLTGHDLTSVRIGRIDTPTQQMYDNCIKVLQYLNDPNILSFGYTGIQSLFLTTQTYPSLPIWFNVPSDLDSDLVPEPEQEETGKQRKKKKQSAGNDKQKKKKVKDDKLYYISDEDVGKKLPQVVADLGEEVDIEDEDEDEESNHSCNPVDNKKDEVEEGDENENIEEADDDSPQVVLDSFDKQHENGVAYKHTNKRKQQNIEQEKKSQNEELKVVDIVSSAAGKRKRQKSVQNIEKQIEGDNEEQPHLQSKKAKKKKGKSKENKNFLLV
eukprot:TRINITY_DN5650_c0_g2_i5.p1 TRINITY_DN5650_c0_g2~~TRINITY_DN5650_c0_g2_i5.p1  ORF type:complete len:496 (-),score=87.54 TRINITY_DN5650_c0_g2_i5:2265-3638(-)